MTPEIEMDAAWSDLGETLDSPDFDPKAGLNGVTDWPEPDDGEPEPEPGEPAEPDDGDDFESDLGGDGSGVASGAAGKPGKTAGWLTYDIIAHGNDLPMNLGPEGDAFRMGMAAAKNGTLLLARPQTGVAPPGAKPLFYARTGKALHTGIWSGHADDTYQILAQANSIGKSMAWDDYEQALAAYGKGSDEEKAAKGLRNKRLAYFSRTMPKRVDDAAIAMATIVDVVRGGLPEGASPPKMLPLVCEEHELNSNLQYIGMSDGVLDLPGRVLLTGLPAAACLVTMTTGLPFELDDAYLAKGVDLETQSEAKATARAVWQPDTLAGDGALLDFLQQAIAHSLFGRPDQTINFLIDKLEGRGFAGKSTTLNAVCHSFGAYGQPLSMDALKGSRGDAGTGRATPELKPLVVCRFVYVEESGQQRLNAEQVKKLTGGGEISTRGLYENLTRRHVIATVFLSGNQPPRIDLTDNAEMRRYRPIPMPQIDPDREIKSMVYAFNPGIPGSYWRRAELLQLIMAKAWEMEGPPDAPDIVKELALEHQAKQAGVEGEWIEAHISKADGGRLFTRDAFLAFAAMEKTAAGHVKQAWFTKRITAMMGIQSKKMRVGGRNSQGWIGLEMSPEAHSALEKDQSSPPTTGAR